MTVWACAVSVDHLSKVTVPLSTRRNGDMFMPRWRASNALFLYSSCPMFWMVEQMGVRELSRTFQGPTRGIHLEAEPAVRFLAI